jgi:hypothetical protein
MTDSTKPSTTRAGVLLADGEYLATCREQHKLRAQINGYGEVFPQATMNIAEDRATFWRDGGIVWSCSARFAVRHFVIERL